MKTKVKKDDRGNVKLRPEMFDLMRRIQASRVLNNLEKLSYQEIVEIALEAYQESVNKTPEDPELMRRFLRFWREPDGVMEKLIRGMVAEAIGVEEPK